jgi:hypothetical protein
MLGLWSGSLSASEESEEELASGGVGVRRLMWCTELLLRRLGISMVSSYRLLEKKVLLDAVSGVVGVLGACRDGGGLRSRGFSLCSSGAPTLVDDRFNGPKFRGGKLSGCRCFRVWILLSVLLSSMSEELYDELYELFLALGFRCTFVGSGRTGMEMSPVEVLWMLVASRPFRTVFRFSVK